MKTLNEIELYNVGKWTRGTPAEGNLLSNSTIYPLSANDFTLLSAISVYTKNISESADSLEEFSEFVNVKIQEWDETYNCIKNNSASWNDTVSFTDEFKDEWNYDAKLVAENSAHWNEIASSAESGYAASAYIAEGKLKYENLEHSAFRFCGEGNDSMNIVSNELPGSKKFIADYSVGMTPYGYGPDSYYQGTPIASGCSFALNGKNYSYRVKSYDNSFLISDDCNYVEVTKSLAILEKENTANAKCSLISGKEKLEGNDHCLIFGRNEIGDEHTKAPGANKYTTIFGRGCLNDNESSLIFGHERVKGLRNSIGVGSFITGGEKYWSSAAQEIVNSVNLQNHNFVERVNEFSSSEGTSSSGTLYPIIRSTRNDITLGRADLTGNSITLNRENVLAVIAGGEKPHDSFRNFGESLVLSNNLTGFNDLNNFSSSVILKPSLQKIVSDNHFANSILLQPDIKAVGHSTPEQFNKVFGLISNTAGIYRLGSSLITASTVDVNDSEANMFVAKQSSLTTSEQVFASTSSTAFKDGKHALAACTSSHLEDYARNIIAGKYVNIYEQSVLAGSVIVGEAIGGLKTVDYSYKGISCAVIGTNMNFAGNQNSLLVGQNGHAGAHNTISVGVKGSYGEYKSASKEWVTPTSTTLNTQINNNSMILLDRTGNLEHGRQNKIELVRPNGFSNSLIICQDKTYKELPTYTTYETDPQNNMSSLWNSLIVINGPLPRFYPLYQTNEQGQFLLIGEYKGYKQYQAPNALYYSNSDRRYRNPAPQVLSVGEVGRTVVNIDKDDVDIDWDEAETFGPALIVGSHLRASGPYNSRCLTVGKEHSIRYKIGVNAEKQDNEINIYPQTSYHFIVGEKNRYYAPPGASIFVAGKNNYCNFDYWGVHRYWHYENGIKIYDNYSRTTQLVFGTNYNSTRVTMEGTNEWKGLFLGTKGRNGRDSGQPLAENKIAASATGLILSDDDGPFCVITNASAGHVSYYQDACTDTLLGTQCSRFLRFRKNGKWYSIRKYTYMGITRYATMEYA